MARPKAEIGDIYTSPRNVRLLRWLRRKPHPSRIVGETADGDEVTCAVNVTNGGAWKDVLSVVRSCVELRALDKEGSELRRLTLDPDDPEIRAESEMEQALAAVAKSGGTVPIISVDLPKLVDNIARNMREVGTESARANAAAHKEGFAAMVSVVNIALGLLVGVEQRLARAEDALAQQSNTPEGEGDQRQALAMMALQKAMGPNGGNGASVDPGAVLNLIKTIQQQQGPAESEDE